ncbi:hypothetical protein ACI78R_07915 [Geodermatophilus sp. SYSU D01106]
MHDDDRQAITTLLAMGSRFVSDDGQVSIRRLSGQHVSGPTYLAVCQACQLRPYVPAMPFPWVGDPAARGGRWLKSVDEVLHFVELHDHRARASALHRLLAPYEVSEIQPEQGDWWPQPNQTRLAAVPPEVAAQALDLLPRYETTVRLNSGQPPMTWLVDQALALEGHLNGLLRYGFVRFNGITVPARVCRILAVRVLDWPATDDMSPGLDCAQASTWTPWSKKTPSWTGRGDELLDLDLPLGITGVDLTWR